MKEKKVYVQNNQFLFIYQESFYCIVHDSTAFLATQLFTELQTLIKWGEEKVNVLQFMECSAKRLTSEKKYC